MRPRIIAMCQSAVSDKNSGRLSIFNVLDVLKMNTFPALIPEMTLVFTSEKEKGDPKQVSIAVVLRMDKKVLFKKDDGIINYRDKNFNSLIINMSGLVLEGIGTLTFAVKVAGKQIAKYECKIESTGATGATT